MLTPHWRLWLSVLQTVCALDIELDELRSMPPSLIIELPESDRKERLLEMRSLKKQLKAIMDPWRQEMVDFQVRHHPRHPMPPVRLLHSKRVFVSLTATLSPSIALR